MGFNSGLKGLKERINGEYRKELMVNTGIS